MSGGGLCATALKMVYGREDVEASGPVVTGFKVKGCKVQVSFKHAEGLTTTDNAAPVGFELAGADEKIQIPHFLLLTRLS